MNDAIKTILNANTAQDLFGDIKPDAARPQYRKLMRSAHPDMFHSDTDKKQAEIAFGKLVNMWEVFVGKKTAKKANLHTNRPNTIKTRKHEYDLSTPTEDDVFQIFKATYDGGHKSAEIIIAKNSADKDLVDAYLFALNKISADTPDEYKKYFPTLIEKFNYKTASNETHPALAIEDWEGFYTLQEIMKAHPNGLDARNVAWIFRRMLVAIGNAHDIGLVHGAPNLNAFHINPKNHGVFLRAWQYSVGTGETLKAVPQNAKTYYPDYVFNKKPVNYNLDVWVAAKAAITLLGKTEFKPFRAFFNGCLLESVPEPAELLGEFDNVMDRAFGERKFVTFDM